MVMAGRFLAVLLLLPIGTTITAPPPAQAHPARPPLTASTPPYAAASRWSWTGTWETAPSGTTAALPGAAIRNVVHVSAGGRVLRIHLSNRLGTRPLTLDAATVALRATGPDAVPGTMRTATFGGAVTATVPAGRDLVSDPVALAVPAAADLLVTVRTPTDSGPATYHRTALQTSYVARQGDGRAADEAGAAYTATTRHWYYVTGVDVRGAAAAGSVVAFGDSLTDGEGSTRDTNRRWPDLLAERLRTHRLGVLNAGIGGNRLLLDDTGPNALSRLDADALSRAGVRVLIVFEGINDLNGTPEAHDVRAYETAYRAIVARAHARGIRVVGATLTPYDGHSRWTEAHEALRQQINALIRSGRVFDAVADFDAAVRDPDRPRRILPAYDPGDHLHFNDAGMRALAESVDLAALRGTRATAPKAVGAGPEGSAVSLG
ncbi:SGNH/GDSL hydrolase family protein [Streptomyces sp. V3I7]|uniref:SGNH/GDSL hydrolase family protein n=1 Tax=Streptomyces sp. V3I7 TaxID=3042278 RepID=UPI0027D83DD2|nr:SGNH/GDSL hydrolase family protein [Streptomyces sp. V3I7]